MLETERLFHFTRFPHGSLVVFCSVVESEDRLTNYVYSMSVNIYVYEYVGIVLKLATDTHFSRVCSDGYLYSSLFIICYLRSHLRISSKTVHPLQRGETTNVQT